VLALVRLINRAYEAERFFVQGDRTDAAEVAAGLGAGAFLVLDDERDEPVGCVHVTIDGERGAFGMLAVDPGRQRQGLGCRLIAAAEAYVAEHGGQTMEILVVDLRTDLRRLYRRLGYLETGVRPYVHRPTIRPCHFVVMEKVLEQPVVS
jgi:ribosomal protein S18 acetylase RimI-like enzyme